MTCPMQRIHIRKPMSLHRIVLNLLNTSEVLFIVIAVAGISLSFSNHLHAVDGLLDQGDLDREEFVEHNVDEDGAGEAVQPTEAVQVLGSSRDDTIAVDAVSKAREVRPHGEEECNESLPIDAVEVSIAAIWIVECWNVYLPSFDDPVIRRDETSDRREENRVAAHEREECRCGVENLPWDNDPTTHDGRDDTTAKDVNPTREEHSQVVGSRN